ncbi:MAG: DUF502 domain-containing protein [Hyphomicrobiaceae bacterium]
MNRIARVFLAGGLAILPLLITALAMGWLISLLSDYLGPHTAFGRVLTSLGIGVGASAAPYIVGIGLLLLAIYGLGLLVESRIGPWLTAAFEAGIARIPVISRLYDLTRRFTAILDTSNKGGGNLAAMSPVWCFFGGEPGAAVLALVPSPAPIKIGETEYIGVLIPSAPVPVGGALIYVPTRWIKPAEGGVDGLMSVYLSMGVTPPTTGMPAKT